MTKIVDLQHKWATQIGRVFIAFGSIEYITIQCLKTIPTDNIFKSTRNFQLTSRIELIQDLLEPLSDAEVERFVALLQRAKDLAKKRNLLAHNPLMLNVYVNEENDFRMQETVASLRDERKHMTYEELKSLALEAEDLASQLYGGMQAVFRAVQERV